MRRVADALWLFPRTLQTHLLHPVEDEDAYLRDIREERVEYRQLAQELTIARHKPTLALSELSCAMIQLPLDTFQRTTLDAQVTDTCNAMGVCDRIFVSPVPVIYTRFSARFVELFMAFVPFALYKVSCAVQKRIVACKVYLVHRLPNYGVSHCFSLRSLFGTIGPCK